MVKVLEKEVAVACYHCGNKCEEEVIRFEEKAFCCSGCKTVYEILQENNLCAYYDFNENAGVSLKAKNFEGIYDYLDSEEIEKQILDFKSPKLGRVTFYIPSVHCSSCVWLLENFSKVRQGVISSRLNFMKKELAVSYNPSEVSLKQMVELLATLGYAPLINLESANKPKKSLKESHKLLLKIGVVGFCFGNIMLLSFPEYFKLDLQNKVDSGYQKFFLYLNLLLGLPVFFYGASDYIKGAYISLKENIKGTTNVLSVDIPIFMGITALFIRSLYETLVNHSSGYWDSLAGLVLFLLAGKWLQQVTYEFLSFERDYKSYFPLAVKANGKGFVNISEIEKGDSIEIKNNELIPADSILLSESSVIDYSFVTGEAAPVEVFKGEKVFAGGRQMGHNINLLIEKEASQSYLTQLWNSEAFRKEKFSATTNFADKFSKYFTYLALSIAAITGVYWYFNDASQIWNTVTAVLMVACPCALTLALPFGMNMASNIYGKNKFFVKNQAVIPLMAEVDTLVFDKTGTLTKSNKGMVDFKGKLSDRDKERVRALTAQSMHPLSKRIEEYLKSELPLLEVLDFEEITGKGIQGFVDGKFMRLGSRDFLQADAKTEGQVFTEVDGKICGGFFLRSEFRVGWRSILESLQKKYALALLSGDDTKDAETLIPYFSYEQVWFNQKPQDKLNKIEALQKDGRKVLMIGDGLNDAGALRQSNVGVALTEDINAFSPSCDAIMDAEKFDRLGDFIRFSKSAMGVVVAGLILSIFYNVIGIYMAASGILSPVYAAVFMPLSSISVVLFTVGFTYLVGKLEKLV